MILALVYWLQKVSVFFANQKYSVHITILVKFLKTPPSKSLNCIFKRFVFYNNFSVNTVCILLGQKTNKQERIRKHYYARDFKGIPSRSFREFSPSQRMVSHGICLPVKDKTEFLKLIAYPFKGIQSINQFYLPLRSYLFIVDIRQQKDLCQLVNT